MTEQEKYLSTLVKKKISFFKEVISGYYKLPLAAYDTKNRKMEVIKLKYVTIWMILKKFKKQITLEEIGKSMGYDHSTVIHANKQIENYLCFDLDLKRELDELSAIIENSIMVIDGNVDINDEYDYSGLDACMAVKDDKAKSLVFSGYSQDEVYRILNLLEMTELKILEFKKTGMYLIKKRI